MGLKAVFSICLVCVVGGDRLKESIYTDFDQFQACFKRLNATMEFGCTSDLSGNVGVLLYIDSQDISRVEVDDFAPYIILLSPDIFSGSMLTRLKNTGNVNGILLPGVKTGKWKGKLPAVQSDDVNCPNSGSSTAEKFGEQNTIKH
ncbi:nicastrin-like [Eurytemora carolleeae]|uniref:nicastrin-like n=1 Tax=Eurytemora carolleeae TaxID=1294199 RepID=UPI000C756C9C|nr:nicastrin-like [Eurytemora carolleeae]|eukprot:XP_023337374.1 nicastrin-like [Eurytemora affinis]